MYRALNTAATGMAAQEMNVNNIANNIANVNTVGFKKKRAEFEDLLYQTLKEPGSRSSSNTQYNIGLQMGSGAKVSGTQRINTQGSPLITNNAFDLMINGDGFFGIQMPDGSMKYTRDGTFQIDANRTIVNRMGQTVFPGLTMPPNLSSVNITEDGSVEAYFHNVVQPQVVGQIPVFTFTNPTGLADMGQNLLRETESSGVAVQAIAGTENTGKIIQGSLESSNVEIMNEMTNMIKAQRAYEMNSKVMNVADQMLHTVNSIRN